MVDIGSQKKRRRMPEAVLMHANLHSINHSKGGEKRKGGGKERGKKKNFRSILGVLGKKREGVRNLNTESCI